jgi:methylated-DNA-[protein]-cysteine S-methyltransferase
MFYDVFDTPLGWVGVLATDAGLRRSTLPEPTVEEALAWLGPEIDAAAHDPAACETYSRAIRAYLAGTGTDLTTLAIDPGPQGSFFERARSACRTIPSGETRTYAWLAETAGSPRAVRAAGQAMARNPLPLVIPCHRVVGSDGGLHGFGGAVGLPMKAKLLELERRAAAAAA